MKWTLFSFSPMNSKINGHRWKKKSIQFRSSSYINCLFICITKSNSKPFLSTVLVSFPASKTSRATVSSPFNSFNKDTRKSRYIYSNPLAVQWPACLAALFRPSPRWRRRTVWARLWKRHNKDFHVSGKSIKIARWSHGFSRLSLSQRDLQRFTESQAHGKISMCQWCMQVCKFIVFWVMFADSV